MCDSWMKNKVIRVRWKKNYSEASNHVAIGKVLYENNAYVALECRTFHFRKILNGSTKGILKGDNCVRLIPWQAVEVIHELDQSTKLDAPLIATEGDIVLNNRHKTVIVRAQDFGE